MDQSIKEIDSDCKQVHHTLQQVFENNQAISLQIQEIKSKSYLTSTLLL